jgi:hypothetical protein
MKLTAEEARELASGSGCMELSLILAKIHLRAVSGYGYLTVPANNINYLVSSLGDLGYAVTVLTAKALEINW